MLRFASQTTPPAQAADPNKVKVVLNSKGLAMYFSRACIPCDRDAAGGVNYLLHIGIYAYRVRFLKTFAVLPPTPAESAEKLEQLRALENGYSLAVAVVDYHGHGIDTPADYAAFFLMGELIEYGSGIEIFQVPKDQRTSDYITGRFG